MTVNTYLQANTFIYRQYIACNEIYQNIKSISYLKSFSSKIKWNSQWWIFRRHADVVRVETDVFANEGKRMISELIGNIQRVITVLQIKPTAENCETGDMFNGHYT